MVFSIAYRFLRDRAVAEELAQDVFLKLHRELPRLQSSEHVKFWLRKAISHRSMDYARSARRRNEVTLDEVHEPVAKGNSSDPLMEAALRKLVASLPDDSRIVVVLRYQEDLEPTEIAQVLGISLGTVKSRLHRSLGLLRQKAQRLIREPIR